MNPVNVEKNIQHTIQPSPRLTPPLLLPDQFLPPAPPLPLMGMLFLDEMPDSVHDGLILR